MGFALARELELAVPCDVRVAGGGRCWGPRDAGGWFGFLLPFLFFLFFFPAMPMLAYP